MKLKYLLYTILTTCFVSCSDFLKENPKTQINKDDVYNNTGTALGALNGCYVYLANYDGYSFNYFHVLSSTAGTSTSIKNNDTDMAHLASLPSNVNIGKMYIGQYQISGAANDWLFGMEKSTIYDEVK